MAKTSSWWQTVPGLLTAIAATITSMGGLILALHQAGILTISPGHTPLPSSSACVDKIAELQKLHREVIATVTTSNMNGTVSYARIPLTFADGDVAQLSGRGPQFFNDRYNLPGQPFSKDKVDNLEVQIAAGQDVILAFTLLTWNSGTITLKPQCIDNFMYAFGPDRKTAYTVHLAQP